MFRIPFPLPRSLHIWLPGYLASLQRPEMSAPAHVWLAITDHYEPFHGKADDAVARERVVRWSRRWPEIADRHRDFRGGPAKFCFFYPQEEYQPHLLDALAEMTAKGIADVDIHIHHDGEGEQNFVDRMGGFIEVLSNRHGLLRKKDGRTVFGFIHGNWALDNSRADGRRCGLNNEITLLKKLGCYADFTLPSAPSPTQTRMVNTIYWAKDDPLRSKSHDTGTPVRIGGGVEGDLLMIPGPLALRWEPGSWKPKVESGELAGYDLPSRSRADVWLRVAPRLGNHIFVKLFGHGTQDRNSAPLLEHGLDDLYSHMTAACKERGYKLIFSTAWEMAQAVEQLRLGRDPLAASM